MKRLPSNWRSRLEIVWEEDGDYIDLILQFKKGLTPRGCGRRIGCLDVIRHGQEIWVDETKLDLRFRRRGLGKLMYETMLKRFGNIHTLYHKASEDAQRVWKSLCKKYPFEADFFSGQLSLRAS